MGKDENLKVKLVKDKSVDRLLRKTTKEIKKKVERSNIKISEKRLNEGRTPLKRFFSVCLNIISTIVFLLAIMVFTCSVISMTQALPTSIAGFSTLEISSSSMEASGLYKGNRIVVKSVNAKSLKEGDVIAFYVEPNIFSVVDQSSLTVVNTNTDNAKDKKGSFSIEKFIGIHSKAIRDAVHDDGAFIIHHIKNVYEDKNGVRYFSTYGSSNGYTDPWLVREDLIVGVYDATNTSKVITVILNGLNNPIVLSLVIIIPLTLLIFSIMNEVIKLGMILKLQNDVLRGRRLLTDLGCVKYDIGYKMSEKEKLEVLATAPDELKTVYVSLLWRSGTAPKSIRKHYLKKSILLNCYREYNELDRSIELMYKDGIDENIIAKHYMKNRQAIEEKEARYKALMKKMKTSSNKNIKENANTENDNEKD